MAKYSLVFSYYDSDTKSYNSEMEFRRVEGESLSSLAKIDEYTCGYTQRELYKLMASRYREMNFNNIAVKYVHSKDDEPVYYKAIFNNSRFLECAKSSRKTRMKGREVLVVDSSISLYKQELKNLVELLNNRKEYEFNKMFPGNKRKNELALIIARYLKGYYDNDKEREDDYGEIMLLFSKYTNFRAWIIGRNELKNINNWYNTNKIASKEEDVSNEKEKEIIHRDFSFDNAMVADNFVFDDEEFLDSDDDLEQMYDYDHSRVKRRR